MAGSTHSSTTMASSIVPEKEIEPTSAPKQEPLAPIQSKPEPQNHTDIEKQPAVVPPHLQFPNGGKDAWLAVFGAFFVLVSSFGWINAVGVFQDYYQTDLLSNEQPSTISWIISLEAFFMFALGPIFGWVFDNYGPRQLLLVGTFFHVFGLMMASLGHNYYQILLAQGICSPIGSSMIFNAAMSSVVTWFAPSRRSFALGITAAGSSLGGIIFPIMITHLIPQIGFAWTMRAAAFLILGMLIIANLTIKARSKPTPRPFHPLVFVKPLRELRFNVLAFSALCTFFGILVPFNFLSLSATSPLLAHPMSTHLASYLLAILNASSIFGRTIPGWAAGKLGNFNVTITMCALSGITILALWLPARGNAAFIVFAVLYGFGSGAFVSQVPALVAQISDIREIGVRNGTTFGLISVGALCGNPIAGALLSKANGSYDGLKIFSGCMIVAGTLGLIGTRTLLTNGKIGGKI